MLGNALAYLSDKDSRYDTYIRIYNLLRDPPSSQQSLHNVHAVLLLLRDLLDSAIDFMAIPQRYSEATDLVIKFIDHKEKQCVRSTSLNLMFQGAHVDPRSRPPFGAGQTRRVCCLFNVPVHEPPSPFTAKSRMLQDLYPL